MAAAEADIIERHTLTWESVLSLVPKKFPSGLLAFRDTHMSFPRQQKCSVSFVHI
jgi:hypothetical protein